MKRSTLRSVAVICALLLAGCTSLPETDETAGWSAQKIYSEAKSSMQDGGYDRAIRLYERLEARYPYGRYAQQAQLDIAYTYYKSQEPALAIAAADRFIRLHPNHEHVDYAYYLKGLASFNDDLGLFGGLYAQDLTERDPKGARESFETFRELVTRYPDSIYAKDASQRMQYLVNSLANYQVHVSRYYYNRGAYVASVKRAQAVIADYPGTPATEEALFLLVKSYDALGMTGPRDDADRVMRLNFPESVYFSGGPQNDKSWWKFW